MSKSTSPPFFLIAELSLKIKGMRYHPHQHLGNVPQHPCRNLLATRYDSQIPYVIFFFFFGGKVIYLTKTTFSKTNSKQV